MLRTGRWDVRRFESVASTNDWLLAEAKRGAPAGLVAVTRHQSVGRGRLGRRWEAPPGTALLASVLLRPLAPPGSLYACTAAVALAAADACRTAAGVDPGIKWPNDLVVPARGGTPKLAGVLAEADPASPGGRAGSVAVVTGVGLNVAWAPEGATCVLAQLAASAPGRAAGPSGAGSDPGAPPGGRAAGALVEGLLAAWLDALGPRVPLLDTAEGRAAVIAELRGRCVTVGQRVRVDLGGGRVVTGTAVRVDTEGRLVLAPGGGAAETVVATGDVTHVRPAPRLPG
jgi:BirA family biotin operon repressor/biotin-[acetyl-CoA-carboxylase] ligase